MAAGTHPALISAGWLALSAQLTKIVFLYIIDIIVHNMIHTPDICQFWYPAEICRPAKVQQQMRDYAK